MYALEAYVINQICANTLVILNESRDVALLSSGECESNPLLQEQMANAVELYDLIPMHSMGLQSGPMDVDASANEGDYDDLYESPM